MMWSEMAQGLYRGTTMLCVSKQTMNGIFLNNNLQIPESILHEEAKSCERKLILFIFSESASSILDF